MKRAILLSFVAGLLAPLAQAAEPQDSMQAYLDANIVGWAQHPVIVQAIASQNARTKAFDAARIDELDRTWRAQVGTSTSELIDGVLMNSAADFLRSKVAESDGVVTEIFVMDAQGLNVAASDTTSDYWQGDEAKHQETYAKGAGAVHFSEIDFDESSQTYQAQISMTIVDPASGAAIGAITVGIDAESLM